MKVRSSVKKLCEGCKVCFVMFFPLVRSGFGVQLEGFESSFGEGAKNGLG